jgi:hypothetical protein
MLRHLSYRKNRFGVYKYTQQPCYFRLVGLGSYQVVSRSNNLNEYEKDNIENAISFVGFDQIKSLSTEAVGFNVDESKYAVKIGDSKKETRAETKTKDGVDTKIYHYSYTAKATFKYLLGIYVDEKEIYIK